jgi:hypothetical protein
MAALAAQVHLSGLHHCIHGCCWLGSYRRRRLDPFVYCSRDCSSCKSGISLWVVNSSASSTHQAEITVDFHFAGSGAEAAIGQLTRLTSLHMSVDRECTALLDEADLPTINEAAAQPASLCSCSCWGVAKQRAMPTARSLSPEAPAAYLPPGATRSYKN